jgi:uncharacterized RDD family membrane protein YckC
VWGGTPDAAGVGSAAPPVGWATPAKQVPREVPGAPGLSFANTAPRVVGFAIDWFIIAFVAGGVAASLGYGRATTIGSGTVTGTSYSVGGAVVGISLAILSFAYFVFCWSGGRRATLGQRLFHMQVGNAFDGKPLTVSQAVKRWLGYGLFLTLFAFNDSIYGLATLVQFVWVIVLLVSIARSPTKQGLHDRFANSAMVRPSTDTSSGLATTCLVIVAILFVLFVVLIVGLIFVGGQVSSILNDVGRSV